MLTIRNYIDAAKRRKKEETGEEGFSLIELIIVVVILGILVAIALPIFGNIQKTAVDSATESATKNAATTATADFAQGSSASAATDVASIASKTSGSLTLVLTNTTTPASASGVCVEGYDTAGSKYIATPGFKSGPGC